MAITAQDVNALRRQTGAGMMDCKKALNAAGGDIEKAIEFLRKKGQKLYADRADRATTEGVIFMGTNETHSYGVAIALSCETDFVAKNDRFQALGTEILATAIAQQPADLAALKAIPQEDGITLEEKVIELIGKIGEKLELKAYEILHSDVVVPYLHTGSQLGVLVGLQGAQANEEIIAAGKDVAMQIAAMNPLAVDKDGIDATTVEKELAIAKDQMRAEGKPEAMLEKIAQGKLNKFFQENTLLHQPFVKDNNQSVAQYLSSTAAGLTVSSFKRVTIAG